MTTIEQLYREHSGKVSDKWSQYLGTYERLFAEYQARPVRLLEIGIQNGGSLEIWAKYFPNAQCLIGCDIDPLCNLLRYDDPRISVIVGDAGEPRTRTAVLTLSERFDLVVDDGSHRSSDIVKAFAAYFPVLVDGGLFVAEDLHCSYYRDWEGGLFDPHSSIAFFKRLADIVNHEHWGVPRTRASLVEGFARQYGAEMSEDLLASVHSVEFVNSICVIRKLPAARNVLGPRVIAGHLEQVVPGHPGLQGSAHVGPDESGNPWSTRLVPPEEAIVPLEVALDAARADLDGVRDTLDGVRSELSREHTRLAAVRAEAEGLRRRLAAGDAEGQALKRAASENARHAALMAERTDALAREVAALRGSTSWRLTAPLRGVVLGLRRAGRIAGSVRAAVRFSGGVGPALGRIVRVVRKDGLDGLRRGVYIAGRLRESPQAAGTGVGVAPDAVALDYAEWVRSHDSLDDASRAAIRTAIEAMPDAPLISIVMPTYNPDPVWFRRAVDSVLAQLYPFWELCIADDASTAPGSRELMRSVAALDPRIKVVFRETNGHISEASNSALALATGRWVGLLDHDDELAEHALYCTARAIAEHPGARLIYSDEDKVDEQGRRHDPYFKPDWNPDLFLSHNLFCHFGVYEHALLREVGGFRRGFEGAQDYDLVLRCIERVPAEAIVHVPRVLYHWRVHPASTASGSAAKPYADDAGRRAIDEHLSRRGLRAHAERTPLGYRVRYALPEQPPLVTVIVPTRNGADLVRQCLDSVRAKTTYPNYEILLVDNGSDDPEALAYFETLAAEGVRIRRDDGPFNYSAINNRAVAEARGEIVALLNNDIEVIAPEWMSEMVSHVLRPEIGAVGAKLLYPDDTIQHAGVLLGTGGVAGHSFHGQPRDAHGYFGRLGLIAGYSAVTAACLFVRKAVFEQVGGLDEEGLKIAFNDIDFCIKVREAGYRNLYTPYAELYHFESKSRGLEDTPAKQARFSGEVACMKARWGQHLVDDPAYNPNLNLDRGDFTLSWPPRVPPLA
jgi:GT2 family glycosyltransferase